MDVVERLTSIKKLARREGAWRTVGALEALIGKLEEESCEVE